VPDPRHVFVYGTLRRASGHEAHRLLAAAEPVGDGWLPGRLYLADGYPGLVVPEAPAEPRRPAAVRGEVYRLPGGDALAALDRYEGCDAGDPRRGLFRRTAAEAVLDDGRRLAVWVYVYNRDTAALPLIASGDYCRRDATDEEVDHDR